MSAIIEPESAQWWVRAGSGAQIRVSAAGEDRSIVLHRRYAGGAVEEIEIQLDELAEVEGALLNARLWLERAVKQHDELRAAEEIAEDEDDAEPDPGIKLATFLMMMLGARP